MRRQRLPQVALLCLLLVLELSDWRWFQGSPQAADDVDALSHSQVFPTSLWARQRVLDRIEIAPTEFSGLQISADAPTPTHPEEINACFLDQQDRGILPDDDPLYCFMSMQR
jgi:hypothetical protein